MIRGFRDKRTEAIYNGEFQKGLPNDVLRSAVRKLLMLNAAGRLVDLARPPNNRLEALKGARKGQYSIRVNDQWRICFRWDDGAFDVEFTDYH